jgi:hypothetical protein
MGTHHVWHIAPHAKFVRLQRLRASFRASSRLRKTAPLGTVTFMPGCPVMIWAEHCSPSKTNAWATEPAKQAPATASVSARVELRKDIAILHLQVVAYGKIGIRDETHRGKCRMLCPESGPATGAGPSDAGVSENVIAATAAAAKTTKGPTMERRGRSVLLAVCADALISL